MRMARFDIPEFLPELAPLPEWLRQSVKGSDASFAAGAALAFLTPLAKSDAPPTMLWRRRLALSAASSLSDATSASLRDHWIFRKFDDDPGPAARIYGAYRSLCEPRPLRHLAQLPLQFNMAASPEFAETLRQAALQAGGPLKIAAASAALVLRKDRQARGIALWLADAILAKALGWEKALPLLQPHIKRADFNFAIEAPDLWEKSIALAYANAAIEAYGLYADLQRRGSKLVLLSTKLRGKDANDGLLQLLSEDALCAQAGRQSSDRAARRFFERLMELGLVRELTGRPSFRLYGL